MCPRWNSGDLPGRPRTSKRVSLRRARRSVARKGDLIKTQVQKTCLDKMQAKSRHEVGFIGGLVQKWAHRAPISVGRRLSVADVRRKAGVRETVRGREGPGMKRGGLGRV